MLGIRSIALLSLAAFASAQGAIDTLDPCGRQCVQQALDEAGSFGCSASNWPCLCGAPNFSFAIRDCAQNACPPGYAPAVTNAASAVCATAILPPNPAGVTPATASTPTSTPATTPPPTPPTSSSQISSMSSASSVSSTMSASSAESPSPSDAAAAAPTAASGTTSTTSATGAASTSNAPAASSSSSGLTQTARFIIIGISAAVVSIALLTVAACFFIRNRRSKQAPRPTSDRYHISHPMPSSGNAYTQNNNSEYDVGSGALEMTSRRYEDMLPRVQPRQMV